MKKFFELILSLAAKRKSLLYLILLSSLLISCGVKNGYVTGQYGKHPLNGQTISETDTANKPTLGLFWQADSLRITLNQGRQLLRARSTKDTLYLYEAPRDTAGTVIRRYSVYIPQHELHIIKYNDSLVYPIMPMTEPCEYPLDIEGMGAKKLQEYYEKEKLANERAKNEDLHTGVINVAALPLELRAGTYFYNYNHYGDCEIDSTQILILHLDGSWQQYKNGTMKNCGIMRKFKRPRIYIGYNYRGEDVNFLDTTTYAGHFRGLKEMRDKPLIKGDFYGVTLGGTCSVFTVFACRKDDMMRFFFDGDHTLMYEATRCGWQRISKQD